MRLMMSSTRSVYLKIVYDYSAFIFLVNHNQQSFLNYRYIQPSTDRLLRMLFRYIYIYIYTSYTYLVLYCY